MKRKISKKKGFTLIEMVIAIAILAIVVAIAIPVGTKIISNAKKNSDQATVATFQTAIEAKLAEAGTYPVNASGAQAAIKEYTKNTKVGEPKQGATYSFYYDATTGQITCAESGSGEIIDEP